MFNSKPTHFVTKKVPYYNKNNKNKLKLYKSCIYEITNNKHVCKQKILSLKHVKYINNSFKINYQ